MRVHTHTYTWLTYLSGAFHKQYMTGKRQEEYTAALRDFKGTSVAEVCRACGVHSS